MLRELVVRDLGVIVEAAVVLGPGMTVITGETGAGKTLLVDAIDLLVGGRADGALVRPGAAEASVEGRFDGRSEGSDDETILRRVVAAAGRSRAYLDGAMATVAALSEAGSSLVDIHGQHAHQRLLGAAAQRSALDRHAGIDTGPLKEARRAVAALQAELAEIGGDERARAREIDLLRHQVGEVEAAGVLGAAEDEALEAEEDLLADATAHREAAYAAHEALSSEGGVGDVLATAVHELTGRAPLEPAAVRLRSLLAEVQDVSHDLRALAEDLEDDPERLEAVRARRQLLRDLRRKYGETLEEVVAFGEEAAARLAHLVRLEHRAGQVEGDLAAAQGRLRKVEATVGAARRKAAPALGEAITERLRDLAMPRATVTVEVGDDPGDDVVFLLAANPGEPGGPLAKAGSGGELARTMLATRLVLGRAGADDAGSTLVFDEVDAGIGGEAALAVGAALAELARAHQVLVVTHLAQVAAFADEQLVVAKQVVRVDGVERTVAEVEPVRGERRVAELARMLTGDAGSSTAQATAVDLLAAAGVRDRAGSGR